MALIDNLLIFANQPIAASTSIDEHSPVQLSADFHKTDSLLLEFPSLSWRAISSPIRTVHHLATLQLIALTPVRAQLPHV
jgi:hypothetical protein